jgi:hypothetical protein
VFIDAAEVVLVLDVVIRIRRIRNMLRYHALLGGLPRDWKLNYLFAPWNRRRKRGVRERRAEECKWHDQELDESD